LIFQMAASSPLAPTFYGHIASTQDGLLLFEACLSGVLNHVARRPHDRERAGLIRSGNVFIYEEHSSGIKRWTDGVPWSPSRILGNFLVYRELEKPFPPGEKKRAMKRNKRSPIAKTNVLHGGPTMSHAYGAVSAATKFDSASPSSPMQKETERSLIGSLVDSYGFKEGGLVKKTVSVTIGGVSHHLVSYYTIADVMNNKFTTPSKDPRFQYITPRPDLITKQNFRTPIDEVENMDGTDEGGIYSASLYERSGYDMVPHRHMSLPNQPSYAHNPGLYQNYGMNSGAGMLEVFAPASSNHGYSTAFTPAPGVYSAAMAENHSAGGYRESRNNLAAASANLPRRTLTFEQYDSVDSGTSGISTALDEPRHTQSGSYPTPSFYGGLKDATNISRSYPPQRPLPTLNVYTSFERQPANPYSSSEGSGTKENAWPVGNASSGHGHYTSSQQQWASMGAS
jgi:Gti1/Pac2 family transcription factor